LRETDGMEQLSTEISERRGRENRGEKDRVRERKRWERDESQWN
jgi:hypothetical protein